MKLRSNDKPAVLFSPFCAVLHWCVMQLRSNISNGMAIRIPRVMRFRQYVEDLACQIRVYEGVDHCLACGSTFAYRSCRMSRGSA
jgi:hypothetical protein